MDIAAQETLLLRGLLEHARQPGNPDALLDGCWGLNYFPERGSVDPHISTLHRKKEAYAESPN
jgi:DNA-binding response OmpR family regulator